MSQFTKEDLIRNLDPKAVQLAEELFEHGHIGEPFGKFWELAAVDQIGYFAKAYRTLNLKWEPEKFFQHLPKLEKLEIVLTPKLKKIVGELRQEFGTGNEQLFVELALELYLNVITAPKRYKEYLEKEKKSS